MITLCYAAKGGSGTTVVACSRPIGSLGPVLLVDLAGVVDWRHAQACSGLLAQHLPGHDVGMVLELADQDFVPGNQA